MEQPYPVPYVRLGNAIKPNLSDLLKEKYRGFSAPIFSKEKEVIRNKGKPTLLRYGRNPKKLQSVKT